MSRPYARTHIDLHSYNEGSTPPAVVIRSVNLGGGLNTISHQVYFVVGGETVASMSLFSHIDAPIRVKQIDERHGTGRYRRAAGG